MSQSNSDLLNFIHIPSVDGIPSETRPSDIDQLFNEIKKRNLSHLVIYFHGGLTDRVTANRSAGLMTERFGAQPHQHAISPVWETGGGQTIQSIISEHADIPLVNRMIRWVRTKTDERHSSSQTSKSLERGDKLGPWIDPLTKEQLDLIEEELAREYAADLSNNLTFQDDVIAAVSETAEYHLQAVNNDVAVEIQQMQARSLNTVTAKGLWDLPKLPFRLARVTRLVLQRERTGRGHGSRATVIEELVREFSGGTVKAFWDNMKNRARDMWRPAQDGSFKPAEYFLRKLAELKRNNPAVNIDLIGHSAGSIAIAHFLAAAEYDHQLTFRNVIFLAPAATMDLFHDEIVTQSQRFERFVMFTMNDAREQADHIEFKGVEIYDRSLLYFVAGALEAEVDQPISGMTRYMSGQPPFDQYKLKRINQFLQQKGRLIVAGDQTPGDLSSDAKTHGGYYAEAVTLSSIGKIFT